MAAVFPAYTALLRARRIQTSKATPQKSRPWQASFVCRGLFMEGIRWKINPKPFAVSVMSKGVSLSYHCSCCGHCCRHIENCVMVESLDAYRMAKLTWYNQHCGISSTDDVLL